MNCGVCALAFKPFSTAHFINPSPQSVCLCVYPPVVVRQRLSENVTAVKNARPTIEELLDASFSVLSLS
jgi:hypothetical protein